MLAGTGNDTKFGTLDTIYEEGDSNFPPGMGLQKVDPFGGRFKRTKGLPGGAETSLRSNTDGFSISEALPPPNHTKSAALKFKSRNAKPNRGSSNLN